MRNFLVVSLMLLTLAACSSKPQPIQVDAVPVQRPALVVPAVDKFNSRNVKWIIVTPENVDQVFADMKKSGTTSIVLFALTSNGYENISLNIADIAKLVKQQQSIVAAYKQYYEETKQQ